MRDPTADPHGHNGLHVSFLPLWITDSVVVNYIAEYTIVRKAHWLSAVTLLIPLYSQCFVD